MHWRYGTGFFIFLFLLLASGCGTTGNPVPNIPTAGSGLKKRVMLIPFLDQAGFGPRVTEQINAQFKEQLGRSSHLILYDMPASETPNLNESKTELGIVNLHGLAKKAGAMGINALVAGVLNPVELNTRKTGLWPFRHYSRIYDISLVVSVVDTLNGTLVLTALESEEISFPLDEPLGQDERFVMDEIMSKAMPDLIKRQVSSVKQGLLKEPWNGRIMDVGKDALTINAGRDVGLRIGHRFEVFALGEPIPAKGGRSYHLLGKKIGQIAAKTVMKNTALAVPLTGGDFQPGQIIRFKP